MNKAVENNIENYDNKILMRIQFLLEVWTKIIKKKINSMAPFYGQT